MSWNFYPFYYLLYHLTRSTIFFLRTCCNIFSTKYLFISRSSNTTTLSISIQKIFKRYEKCICICIMQIVLYPWERLRTLWDTNYFIFALVWVFAFFFFFFLTFSAFVQCYFSWGKNLIYLLVIKIPCEQHDLDNMKDSCSA